MLFKQFIILTPVRQFVKRGTLITLIMFSLRVFFLTSRNIINFIGFKLLLLLFLYLRTYILIEIDWAINHSAAWYACENMHVDQTRIGSNAESSYLSHSRPNVKIKFPPISVSPTYYCSSVYLGVIWQKKISNFANKGETISRATYLMDISCFLFIVW